MCKDDDPKHEKARHVQETPDHRADRKRLTKQRLWHYYWQANTLKSGIHMTRLKMSKSRWEKKLDKYLEVWGEETQSDSLDAKDLIYMAVSLHSKRSYIGQTGRGLVTRCTTHIRQAANYSDSLFFHGDVRKLGVHRTIWYVIQAWDRPQEKITRMRSESEKIMDFDPYWNRAGRCAASTKLPFMDSGVVYGAKKRFRWFKYLQKGLTKHSRAARTPWMWTAERPAKDELSRKTRLEQLHLAVRLARRPWKRKDFDPKSSVSREVRALPKRKLLSLIKLSGRVLDGPGRSIFRHNIELINRGNRTVLSTKLSFKVPGLWLPGVRKELNKSVQKWAKGIGRCNVMFSAYYSFYPKASSSVQEIFNNAKKIAREETPP